MTEIPEIPPVPDRKLADAALVRSLIAVQFPRWSGLCIRPVDAQGWDNRTFRLGDDLLVRLPTAGEYALAVEKEQRWLPVFAPALPVPIPVPLARGVPDEGFPHSWSVYTWLDGEPASHVVIDDMEAFAVDLAEFLVSLQRIDPTGGPGPGLHNWFRGGPLAKYDQMTRQALMTLDGVIRTDAVEEIWEQALRARWDGRPVWFHGDVAGGNLLVRDGVLSAVIDFGTAESATRHVIWPSPGPCYPARAGMCSGIGWRSTKRRGCADRAGRSGRHWSVTPEQYTTTTRRPTRRTFSSCSSPSTDGFVGFSLYSPSLTLATATLVES